MGTTEDIFQDWGNMARSIEILNSLAIDGAILVAVSFKHLGMSLELKWQVTIHQAIGTPKENLEI